MGMDLVWIFDFFLQPIVAYCGNDLDFIHRLTLETNVHGLPLYFRNVEMTRSKTYWLPVNNTGISDFGWRYLCHCKILCHTFPLMLSGPAELLKDDLFGEVPTSIQWKNLKHASRGFLVCNFGKNTYSALLLPSLPSVLLSPDCFLSIHGKEVWFISQFTSAFIP